MAQAGPYARKLACDLINDQFGEQVQKVCDCLISRGQLQLADIGRYTEIPLQQLRNCLLVLIQHNCVQAFNVEQEDGDPKRGTFYIAIVDNVLHRMRFPKFLMLVQQELGKEAEGLVSGLLLHGRLTLEQLIQRSLECAQTSESEVDMPMKETFASLVQGHFVERCPAAEPKLVNNEEPSKKKLMKTNILEETPERVVSAAALMEAERFRVPEFHVDENDAEMLSTAQKKRKRSETDDANTPAAAEKEVLWRVNYEEFIRRLRHQACVRFVRSQTDLSAGTIVSCMLNATRHSEKIVRVRVSDVLNMEAIRQALMAVPEGRTMTMDRIRPSLQSLVNDGYVDYVGGTGSDYVVNMHNIIELSRQNEIYDLVLQKYGQNCRRIFKLLNTKGFSEHKQISDKSLVPVKETWELLYKLARGKYVEHQEIPKTADRSPGKTCYFWRVNPANVTRNVLNDMYHAAWNLGRRLAHELEKEQELLNLSKLNSAAFTTAQQDQANRLSNIAKVLETSLLKLDDTLLLFHDF